MVVNSEQYVSFYYYNFLLFNQYDHINDLVFYILMIIYIVSYLYIIHLTL